VLTTTGGGAALVVDRLGSLGIETIAAPDDLLRQLAELGLSVSKAPIIDLTLAGARKGIYKRGSCNQRTLSLYSSSVIYIWIADPLAFAECNRKLFCCIYFFNHLYHCGGIF
jgi:hypothetical protein